MLVPHADDGTASVTGFSTAPESVVSHGAGLDSRASDIAAQEPAPSEYGSSIGHGVSAHNGPITRARMQPLWRWSCNLTAGRNVSCMSWNHDSTDLLAVGYGSFDFGKPQGGLVCIWSLQNPSYPLWQFEVKAGVTAMEFSSVTGVCTELCCCSMNASHRIANVRNC
jgi:hypothetical protein